MPEDPGRAPLVKPDVRSAIATVVGNGDKRSTNGNLWPRELMPIDYELAGHPDLQALVARYTAAKTNAATVAGVTTYPFRFWQVEALLDQAADLLERAIRDRAAFDSLRAQLMRLNLEISEFDELNKVHDDEIKAGYYTLDRDQSVPEQESERLLAETNKAAGTLYQQLLANELSDPNIAKLSTEAGVLAKAASYSSYAGQHDAGINPKIPHPVNSVYIYDPGCQHPTKGETLIDSQNGSPGAGTAKGEVLRTLSTNQSTHNLIVEKVTSTIQSTLIVGTAQAGEKTVQARAAKATWDTANASFQRRRSDVAVTMNEAKRAARDTPGGALNYEEQKNPILARFTRDFIDAYARLLAAQDGLSRLYNYKVPLPPLPANNSQYQGIFDAALVWTREAIRFLVSFSHLEQSFTIPVSVKSLVGTAPWQAAITSAMTGGATEAVFQFDITESDVPNFRSLRLRGISAYVLSQSETGPWALAVTVPKKATIRFADDNSIGQLDQGDVPAVVSARVLTRFSQRDADVVGVSSLRNSSPISDSAAAAPDRQWTVRIRKSSLTNHDLNSLDDIHLDLHLVARS